MSHFNLNGGITRKRFIGPDYRLSIRPAHGPAIGCNQENLGGRMIIENRMVNHAQRMKSVKPSIDSSMPWAHRLQDDIKRSTTPNTRTVVTHNNPEVVTRPSTGTSTRPASGSRAPTAATPHLRPPSAKRLGSSHKAELDVNSLPAEHQGIVRDMISVLCSLNTNDSKALLEQVFRESEEKRLLAAYTGVFPTLQRQPNNAVKQNDEEEYAAQEEFEAESEEL